jgi:hypothetical protein
VAGFADVKWQNGIFCYEFCTRVLHDVAPKRGHRVIGHRSWRESRAAGSGMYCFWFACLAFHNHG